MGEQSYASSSVARKVAAVKSFFNFLHSRSLVEQNPTTQVDSPKVKKRLPQTLDFEDVDRLLQAPTHKRSPKNLRDTALLAMLYATGMRVTEVVSLRQQDVDLENLTLSCPIKVDQVRELPFDEETKGILSIYLDEGRPYLVKDNNEEALFLNHRGQHSLGKDCGSSSRLMPKKLIWAKALHHIPCAIALPPINWPMVLTCKRFSSYLAMQISLPPKSMPN